MTMSYTVILHDYPGLSARARTDVERRYQQALEHALGGPGGVLLAWKTWQRAERASGDFPLAEWHIARRWLLAADRARAASLAGLPDRPDAAFELRPA